jgi:demethylmenaquinone methyltransferase/2-methoxy-6-polyprenyl-1,4-benzoquinol methylase
MTLADLDPVDVARAVEGGSPKREYVRRIFSEIAPRYDLLNHLLSFNIDRRWRRRALARLDWQRSPTGVYLDLCAGTLDVAAQLAGSVDFRGTVLGADFAEPMLRAGRAKVRPDQVTPVVADALGLPLTDRSVDGAIVAFGIRNLASLSAGLSEVFRVLRPGGRFVILEFSTPRSPLVRGGYHLYFHQVLPLIGRLVSGHPTAYRYLPESVKRFPEQAALAQELWRAGFVDVAWENVTLGVAAIHWGVRP